MLHYDYSWKLPAVANPHEVAIAFYRTSAWGEWLPDDNEKNDSFALHLKRGTRKSWVRAVFWDAPPANDSSLMKDLSMSLRLTFRPAPDSVTLGVHYSVPQDQGFGVPKRKVRVLIDDEVKGFAAYIQEVYHLPEIAVETDETEDG